MKHILLGAVASFALTVSVAGAIENNSVEQSSMSMAMAAPSGFDGARLDAVLKKQDDAAKARYKYRHPKETLEFFGIEPGMNVVELVPGGGWYSKILLPYLGKDGQVTAVGYADPLLRSFSNGETTERMWNFQYGYTKNTVESLKGWAGEDGAQAKAFLNGELPHDFIGTADAVLAIRGLHHLNRFDVKNFEVALDDFMTILKPGGVVGVVQHEAAEDADDKWANGDNGYLKKSLVIKRFKDAGFEFVAETDLNENPKDKPGAEDGVWRLPPTLGTSQEDEALRKKMEAIGESNRMTLLFRKPKS